MTHEELLKRTNSTNRYFGANADNSAVRAVLKLHKPQEITLPDGSWGENCAECDGLFYPCPTIQAIEKELK